MALIQPLRKKFMSMDEENTVRQVVTRILQGCEIPYIGYFYTVLDLTFKISSHALFKISKLAKYPLRAFLQRDICFGNIMEVKTV